MFCSAGEISGDMHGAALIKEAALSMPRLSFFGLGGDLMAAQGCTLLAHLRDTAVMGFTEILGSIPRILRTMAGLKRALRRERPAAAVLIDSPDLNLPLARACKALGIPVVYFVCPQVWAWREGRLRDLKELASRRALIFPFEERFYRDRGVPCDLVGHPLFDEIEGRPKAELRAGLGLDPGARVLAVLPGSRPGVFRKLAPSLLAAASLLLERDPGLRAVLALSPIIGEGALEAALAPFPLLRERSIPVRSASREAMGAADAVLLASGTSVIEAAILGTPMVVGYKVSAVSWALARALVRVPFAAAANLVAGRRAVPEFLQGDCSPANLAGALAPLLSPGPARDLAVLELKGIRDRLGGPGASGRVLRILAEEIERGRNA